ncbi:hypothetical protein K1X84_16365 [bacterium]|nr:hypothetical protein [bacterium]
MKRIWMIAALAIGLAACQKPTDKPKEMKSDMQKKIDQFGKIEISVNMDQLSTKEKEMVKLLVKAGEYADKIFWKQTSYDAIPTREMLAAKTDQASKEALEYVNISYGPYDRITGERFVGEGSAKRPDGGTFYPADMTREEFEKYIKGNPGQEKELTGQYTVVVRDGNKLKGVPYHDYYKDEIAEMAKLLTQASELAENESLKKYLAARAKAITSDDYYESDVLWMKLKDNNVDIVIGPVENYEDGMFNYKTAFEAAVMVKDPEGTKELQVFQSHIDALEQNLPSKKEYIRKNAGKGNVLEVVNIAFFGGDFQAGIKTIAASLPNDPKVHDEFGGKKQMYKNLMEAKFEKILVPIGTQIISEENRKYIDKHAFTTFVTMHEVSHTLGRGYVYGNDKLEVRKALKEMFSPLEEAKADVVGIYNMEYFKRQGIYDDEMIKKFYVTYLVGLFRSIRFGAEDAHGQANIAQMAFLKEQGALGRDEKGNWVIHFDKFHTGVTALAKTLLELQAEGNYEGAKQFLAKYGEVTADIKADIEKMNAIPRDLNTTYAVTKM